MVMAFSTRRLLGWAGPIKKVFKMHNEEPDTRSNGAPPPSALQDASSYLPPDTEYHTSSKPSDLKSAIGQASVLPSIEEPEEDITLSEKMEQAKALYPGSKDWAKDEERLFEILYLRQDLPILPPQWKIDFRGIPIPENIFDTSDEHPAIVYPHCKNGSTHFTGEHSSILYFKNVANKMRKPLQLLADLLTSR